MISVECVTKTDDDHVLIPGFSSILKPTHTVYSHEYLYREVLRLGTRQWAKKPRKLRLKIKEVQKLPPLTSCSLYDCVKSQHFFFFFSFSLFNPLPVTSCHQPPEHMPWCDLCVCC